LTRFQSFNASSIHFQPYEGTSAHFRSFLIIFLSFSLIFAYFRFFYLFFDHSPPFSNAGPHPQPPTFFTMSNPMFSYYDRYSDDQLTETLEFKRNYLRTFINRDLQWSSAQYFDKEINCLETILQQRSRQNAAVKALKDKSDDEGRMVEAAKEDDREDCDEVVVDDEVHPQSLLAPLPQSTPSSHHNVISNSPPDVLIPRPFSPSPNISPQLPHNLILSPTTTSPSDIVAPRPFPPSPNISVRPSQFHSHHPHNHCSLDIVTPQPLPLKPNIPVYSFLMFEDEHHLKGGRCVIPFPLFLLSLSLSFLFFDKYTLSDISSPYSLSHSLRDLAIFSWTNCFNVQVGSFYYLLLLVILFFISLSFLLFFYF
jgi:hypothetical protein